MELVRGGTREVDIERRLGFFDEYLKGAAYGSGGAYLFTQSAPAAA
jgi:hypothetical protein